VLAGGSAVTRWRQGVAGEHRWGPAVAPGKKSGDGAHRGGRTAVVIQGVADDAAAPSGGGGVPQLVADAGKVVAGSVPERDEKRGAGERKIRPAADGSTLLGGGGRDAV
jgi:hypothetical protein